LIARTVTTVQEYLDRHEPGCSYEIVLIDDGSTDNTGDIVTEMGRKSPSVRPVLFPAHRGRGAALRAGIDASKGAYVIALDADLSYDEKHVGSILDCFKIDPKTDAVIVSPYMKGGYTRGVPWGRLSVSRLANWLLAGFFDGRLSTVTCLVRGYRGALIRAMPLSQDGKEVQLEILRELALAGAKTVEIPGRLEWKRDRNRVRSRGEPGFVRSGVRHLWYAVTARPARMFGPFACLCLLLALLESYHGLRGFLGLYEPAASGHLWRNVWIAVVKSVRQSPQVYGLAGLSYILSLVALSFLRVFRVRRAEQEKAMRRLVIGLEQGERRETSI
jgi:glycosyltransferase involved in cell wall biosynthesis